MAMAPRPSPSPFFSFLSSFPSSSHPLPPPPITSSALTAAGPPPNAPTPISPPGPPPPLSTSATSSSSIMCPRPITCWRSGGPISASATPAIRSSSTKMLPARPWSCSRIRATTISSTEWATIVLWARSSKPKSCLLPPSAAHRRPLPDFFQGPFRRPRLRPQRCPRQWQLRRDSLSLLSSFSSPSFSLSSCTEHGTGRYIFLLFCFATSLPSAPRHGFS